MFEQLQRLNALPPVKTPVRQRITSLVSATLRAQEQRQALAVDPLMPLAQVVPLLGNPCYSTLRAWIKSGSLRVWRSGSRGHFKVRLSEVVRFVAAGEVRGKRFHLLMSGLRKAISSRLTDLVKPQISKAVKGREATKSWPVFPARVANSTVHRKEGVHKWSYPQFS